MIFNKYMFYSIFRLYSGIIINKIYQFINKIYQFINKNKILKKIEKYFFLELIMLLFVYNLNTI